MIPAAMALAAVGEAVPLNSHHSHVLHADETGRRFMYGMVASMGLLRVGPPVVATTTALLSLRRPA